MIKTYLRRVFGRYLVPFWEKTAMTHFMMARYAKAEEFFRKIEEVQPKKDGLVHYLGLVSLAQDRFEEAEKAFLHELETFGEAYIRFKSLADTYFLWGRAEKSADYYRKSFSLCQNDADKDLINKRIEQCGDEAAFAKAMKSIQELKQGNRNMAIRNFDAAYECFKKASKTDPYNFQAFNNLGALEMNHKKNAAGAVECFERASNLTSLPAIHANLKHARSLAAKEAKK